MTGLKVFRPDRWAWSLIDKDGTGRVSPKDLRRVLAGYNPFIQQNIHISKLIYLCDANQDGVLEDAEMQRLLTVTTPSARAAGESQNR